MLIFPLLPIYEGPGWLKDYLPTHTAYHEYGVGSLCILQKRCTRLAATSKTVYQLLAHGRWFSPGTPASFTTKLVAMI